MTVLARVEGFPCQGGPIDVTIRAGETVRIVGPNGSGKTSLLRALAGLPAALAPQRTHVDGHDPRQVPADRLARRVAFVPQAARDGLIGLTVAGEARLRGRAVPATLWGGQEVASLSSGEARRLALALAEAPLLLLDEPDEGLDSEGLRALHAQVHQHQGAVVVADHAGHFSDVARTIQLGPLTTPAPFRVRPSAGPPALRMAAVTAEFPGHTVHLPAVEAPAGFTVITGPNGAGKSTLLQALAGLGPGRPTFQGRPVAGSGVQWLPAEGRRLFHHSDVAAEVGGRASRLVPEAIMGRHPWSLSGGEGQRVALAKVLGMQTQVYLLDEPEAHLDEDGRRALAEAIDQRLAEGACVVAATHDDAIIQAAGHVIRLEASS